MQAESLIIRMRDYLDDAPPTNTVGGRKAGVFWSDRTLLYFLNASQFYVARLFYKLEFYSSLSRLLRNVVVPQGNNPLPADYMFALRGEANLLAILNPAGNPAWEQRLRPTSVYLGGSFHTVSNLNWASYVRLPNQWPIGESPKGTFSQSFSVNGGSLRLYGAPWGKFWYFCLPSRISLSTDNLPDYGVQSFDDQDYEAILYHAVAAACVKEYESTRFTSKLEAAGSYITRRMAYPAWMKKQGEPL